MDTKATLEHWPIVLVQIGEDYRDDDLRGIIGVFEEAFERGEKYVNIVEPQGIKSIPNPAQRALLMDWANLERTKDMQSRWNLGTAVLIESPIVRGAMTAFSWIWKSPTELAYVKNIAEAAAWCAKRIEEEGVDSTAASTAYVSSVGG